jgi:hypothetical protein
MKKTAINDIAHDYEQSQYGTWGRFQTPAGAVEFLETKARIGSASKDREKRLTTFLRPVREVLKTQSMDFNQLLQRDLDDHRVATGLVPYILNPSKFGPAFFPPIVAALLPFDGSNPVPCFPECAHLPRSEDDIAFWEGYCFGGSFKFERMQSQKEGLGDNDIKLGRLSWNPEEAKLVVIDGQHRAMALLAIDRTINNLWNDSGEKYKYFYEPVIREALKNKTVEEKQQLFSNLEFPVTIVWFPNANENEKDHHAAARKLFVDVNQNARTPSESRLLLLSDADLLSIFTRQVLNEFRHGQNRLPIYAVEYDHPGRDQASSSKWSVITNAIIIRDCVQRTVFGPSKFINSLTTVFGGKESESDKSSFMRTTLEIADEIGETIEDLKRDQISNTEFPLSKRGYFESQFMKGWGLFVVRTLSEITPYKAHGEALQTLNSNWATAGSVETLAKDAVFEGVGMYWTIRDSHRHWMNSNQLRIDVGQAKLDKTDIIKTWDAINQKQGEFEKLRAKAYLEKDDVTAVKLSNESFEVLGTNACQLGLALTGRTLAHFAKVSLDAMPTFVSALISAVNVGLENGPKMSTIVPQDVIVTARDKARASYYSYLVREWTKSLKRTEFLGKPTKDAEARAEEEVSDLLAKALSKWFGLKRPEFDAWKAGNVTQQGLAPVTEDDSTEDLSPTASSNGDEPEADSSPASFEDLLGKDVEKD